MLSQWIAEDPPIRWIISEGEKMSAAQWIVLDNLKNGWDYKTNLDAHIAENAYLACVRDGLIKDGKITDSGRGLLMVFSLPQRM